MRTRTGHPVVRKPHRHAWLWEPLEGDATFVLRSMFGAKAAYLGGKIVLCFCAREEPWSGLLICTDRNQHESLAKEFGQLAPHPVLPKWLYLPESNEQFEGVAVRLVRLARLRDPRIGVAPKVRASRKTPKAKR